MEDVCVWDGGCVEDVWRVCEDVENVNDVWRVCGEGWNVHVRRVWSACRRLWRVHRGCVWWVCGGCVKGDGVWCG